MTPESSAAPENRVFVVMGVSGSGKSAVARELGIRLEAAVLDGDFLHPRANILKMASGDALSDDDRVPWLGALNDAAFAMQRTQAVSIIVCSALKRRYRDRLREGNPNLKFLYLKGDAGLIESRMRRRKGHFFKPAMLLSQFEALEEPDGEERDVVTIRVDPPLEEVVAEAVRAIRRED